MPKFKEMSLSSKRTMKIREEYISFESSLAADISDLSTEDEVTQWVTKTYEMLNCFIDEQCCESVQALSNS